RGCRMANGRVAFPSKILDADRAAHLGWLKQFWPLDARSSAPVSDPNAPRPSGSQLQGNDPSQIGDFGFWILIRYEPGGDGVLIECFEVWVRFRGRACCVFNA